MDFEEGIGKLPQVGRSLACKCLQLTPLWRLLQALYETEGIWLDQP
jgi:hypothetical protein